MSRATCPTCRQNWPEGKDPADMMDGLMSMRLSDLCKGVAGDEKSVDGLDFGQEVVGEDLAGRVAWRALSLQDAQELLEAAMEKVQAAQNRFATCPAMLSLPAFIQERGQPGDGLTAKRLDVAGVRIEWDGLQLSFKDTQEREQEDGQWLSI